MAFRLYCASLLMLTALQMDLHAGTQIIVLDGDKDKNVPVAGASVRITTKMDLRRQKAVVVLPDKPTGAEGVLEVGDAEALVAECERIRRLKKLHVSCQELRVHAEHGAKAGKAYIMWTEKGWQRFSEKDGTRQGEPGRIVLRIWGGRVEYQPKATEYWKITPLYVRVTRWVPCTSATGTIERPVYEWRIVGICKERIPASQVPPGARISPTMPKWVLPYLKPQPCECHPALDYPAYRIPCP